MNYIPEEKPKNLSIQMKNETKRWKQKSSFQSFSPFFQIYPSNDERKNTDAVDEELNSNQTTTVIDTEKETNRKRKNRKTELGCSDENITDRQAKIKEKFITKKAWRISFMSLGTEKH